MGGRRAAECPAAECPAAVETSRVAIGKQLRSRGMVSQQGCCDGRGLRRGDSNTNTKTKGFERAWKGPEGTGRNSSG